MMFKEYVLTFGRLAQKKDKAGGSPPSYRELHASMEDGFVDPSVPEFARRASAKETAQRTGTATAGQSKKQPAGPGGGGGGGGSATGDAILAAVQGLEKRMIATERSLTELKRAVAASGGGGGGPSAMVKSRTPSGSLRAGARPPRGASEPRKG